MSLDRVVEEIHERGRQEAAALVEAARRERERMLSGARQEGEELVARREEAGREEAARQRTREIARAELEARKIVLQAQKEVLDTVLERARDALGDPKRNEALLKALVEGHREEMEGMVVRCRPEDTPLLEKLLDGPVESDLECLGGFVLESREGDLRVDLTFDSFLEEVWEDAVRELARVLWEGG